MSKANLAECRVARVQPSKVEALSKRLSACARDAEKMGLTIFGDLVAQTCANASATTAKVAL